MLSSLGLEIDVSSYWKEIDAFDVAMRVKNNYPNTTLWTNRPHCLSKAGEVAWGMITNQTPDFTVRLDRSDPGFDFPDLTDVKAVPYRDETFDYHLKHTPEYRSISAKRFVLAIVDVPSKRVALSGQISTDDFVLRHLTIDYGHGERWYVSRTMLDPIVSVASQKDSTWPENKWLTDYINEQRDRLGIERFEKWRREGI